MSVSLPSVNFATSTGSCRQDYESGVLSLLDYARSPEGIGLSKIMEDYGYTFEDISEMTIRQRDFLLASKAARIEEESKQAEEIRKKSKVENRGVRGMGVGQHRGFPRRRLRR